MIKIIPIQTPTFHLGDSLADFIFDSLTRADISPARIEGSVVAVTSKIVSLAERRLFPKNELSKEALVRRESDHFYGEIGHGCFLTIKHGLLIPSAGIDESNSETGDYILFPEHPYESAHQLRRQLMDRFAIKKLGILLTDSRTSPLRAGVTGTALAYAGFRGVVSRIGQPDLFGRPLKMTQINVADALATSAVLCMGEANESCPLAWVQSDILEFTDEPISPLECQIPLEQDLYYPLLAGY